MSPSSITADSILAIDVGSVYTRAVLFDVVENSYRFLGQGTAFTTAGAPHYDISEGVRQALGELQAFSGRTFLSAEKQLVLPSQADGSGVDKCVATLSVGPVLRVVAVGLLEDVSAQSAQNLAMTTYSQVMEVIHMNDRRATAARLDAVLRARPDLVIVAGGTEGGAAQSLMNLLEAVGLASYVLPKGYRPALLFAGNQDLIGSVRSSFGDLGPLFLAPNIRPAVEVERLLPAQGSLTQVYRKLRLSQISGAQDIDQWTSGKLMPTASAFGRTIRFIGNEYAKTNKGVLGIDVGAASTTVAAAFSDNLILNVHPRLGLGESLPGLLSASSLDEIARWLPVDISNAVLRDYIYNKAVYPASLPATPEELAMEHALACQIIQVAIKKTARSFPPDARRSSYGFLPFFEPIIASGSVLIQAPQRGQTLMMLLNGIQPTGVTTIALDQNNIAAALGAAASLNPLLTVQCLDSNNFQNLCTVISPVGEAQPGTPILRVRVIFSDGSEKAMDIKYGDLEMLKLPVGQTVTVQVNPLHRFDVGMGGPGRSGSVKVVGGGLGLVVDARGRPLTLPAEAPLRIETNKKWLWTLGVTS
jgi:hypothetical protein